MATTDFRTPPLPARPPRHPAAAGRRDPRVALTIGCAVLAFVAAGFAGRVVRGEVAVPEATGPATVIAEVGGMVVVADDTWRRASLSRPLAALAGPSSTVYAPAPGLDARTVITVGPAVDASLLPGELRGALPSSLLRPVRASLLRMDAWRYKGIRMPGGRFVDVTVVPTTAGSLAFTCVTDGSAWSATLLCDGGLRSIDLGSARALKPTAALGAQAALPGAIHGLDQRRRRLRATLSGAGGHRRQARAAGRLAVAYRTSAGRITPLASAIPANRAPRRLVRELRHAGRSYRRLAVAARHVRPVRYRSARTAAGVAERALAAAVAAVR